MHVKTPTEPVEFLLQLQYFLFYFFNLLFEVASLLLIDQHQVQVIAHREFLVDVSHGGSQIIASQK